MAKLLTVLICNWNPFLDTELVLLFCECLWVWYYGANGHNEITRMCPFMTGVKLGSFENILSKLKSTFPERIY